MIEHIPTTSSETPPTTAAALRVSVVIPCLNEEENIEACVRSALSSMQEAGIAGEVVVADNDSEDRSAELATAAGARVVHEPRRGYGSAYLAGFAAARGGGPVRARAAPWLRRGVPGGLRRRPRRVHRHGRRRPHLRLRRDPEVRRE